MVGEDGRHAADHGARGVIVSNHAPAIWTPRWPPSKRLPEVVEAVAGQAEVYMDVAFGAARTCSRPWPWARGVLIGRRCSGPGGGWRGRGAAVLEMLCDELDATMGMCGRTTVDSVDRECLVGVSPYWPCFLMLPRSTSHEFRAMVCCLGAGAITEEGYRAMRSAASTPGRAVRSALCQGAAMVGDGGRDGRDFSRRHGHQRGECLHAPHDG